MKEIGNWINKKTGKMKSCKLQRLKNKTSLKTKMKSKNENNFWINKEKIWKKTGKIKIKWLKNFKNKKSSRIKKSIKKKLKNIFYKE